MCRVFRDPTKQTFWEGFPLKTDQTICYFKPFLVAENFVFTEIAVTCNARRKSSPSVLSL